MSGNAARPAPRAKPARPAKQAPRPAASRRPAGKAGAAISRFGRLGRHGAAVALGVGVVVVTPFVHAFWGDLGVVVLGACVLGFLLGRWTAPYG